MKRFFSGYFCLMSLSLDISMILSFGFDARIICGKFSLICFEFG